MSVHFFFNKPVSQYMVSAKLAHILAKIHPKYFIGCLHYKNSSQWLDFNFTQPHRLEEKSVNPDQLAPNMYMVLKAVYNLESYVLLVLIGSNKVVNPHLASILWDIGKQCKTRSDTTKHSFKMQI